jgi:hypothetical protein
MKIEVLVRWTELKMKSQNDDESYVKRLVDGNSSTNEVEAYYDYSPMVMDINDIARFNRSNDVNFTTLRMTDGEGYVIKFPYKEFIELYVESTGKTVMSCLPSDYEAHDTSINDGAGGDDEDDSEDDLYI